MSKIDPKELAKGVADEREEHDMPLAKARKTARQHLTRVDPHYYSKVEKALGEAVVSPDMIERVRDIAERFLDMLDEGEIESIWLIGSRGGQVNPAYPERKGKPHAKSDWDFLVVGEDFDAVEAERIRLLESGARIYGMSLDADTRTRNKSLDIIFSSRKPKVGVQVWPDEDNLVERLIGAK